MSIDGMQIKASEQIKSAKSQNRKNYDVNYIVQPKQFCTDLKLRRGKRSSRDQPDEEQSKLSIEIRKLFRIDELTHRQTPDPQFLNRLMISREQTAALKTDLKSNPQISQSKIQGSGRKD